MLKGLLIKDYFVLTKQMKFFFLVIAIFAAMDNAFLRGFALMYASMVPVTAIAYDEQSKWDALAQMMPCRARDLVLSKYLLGIGGCVIIYIIEIVSRILYTLLGGGAVEPFSMTGLILCAGLLLLSLNLPLLFKFGVEKGRIFYLILTIGFTALVVTGAGTERSARILSSAGYLPALLAAAALAVSFTLSLKIYNQKRR